MESHDPRSFRESFVYHLTHENEKGKGKKSTYARLTNYIHSYNHDLQRYERIPSYAKYFSTENTTFLHQTSQLGINLKPVKLLYPPLWR